MKKSPLLPLLACLLLARLAAASPEPPKLRLPADVVPKRGALDLTFHPAEPGFSGAATYEVELKKPLDLIWINARDLKIGKATLTVAGAAKSLRVVPGGEEFAGLALDAPAGPGAATLKIEFAGETTEKDTRGFFRQKEGDDWYVFSQFEPVDARRAFPCFDEPSFRIPWKVTIHAPKGNRVFGNGAESAPKDEPDGMVAVSLAETKPISSYLVAIAVGPFDVVDAGKAGTTPLRVITPKGQGSQAKYAAATIGPLLKILEEWFGIPYPFGKLDAVAIPRTVGFGAMENPGLITYASGIILSRPEDEGVGFRRRFASIAAHEMAHQWFGDLVTTAFWDDIWLNESFANWMGAKALARFKPEWENASDRVAGRNAAMGADSLVTARKIRQPILSKDDIANAFDGITYGKGEAVLNMFEAWMGEEPFRKGVRRYLKAHEWGNATAHDFLAALAAEGHPEVPAAFSTFLDQAGVPVVEATLTCAAGEPAKLALVQKRLLPLGSSAAAPQTWQIPVCARYHAGGKDARACTLFAGAKGELALGTAPGCPAWLTANDGARGYYRVAYGGDLLKKLIAAAPQRLSAPEKVGLVSDVSSLAAAGMVSPAEALALAPAFAAEDDRHVVGALAGLVEGVKRRGLPEDELPAFGRFVEKTFGERARALGLQGKPGEDEDVRLTRDTLAGLVAVDGDDAALRSEALALARKWLADHKAVPPDMLGTVLGIAADAGDSALFDGLLDAARKEQDHRRKAMLFGTLGLFRDPALSERAFRLALSPELDARDTAGIFRAAMGDVRTRQLAWDFMKAHWDELLARLPEQMRMYLPYFASGFCDEAHRTDAQAFLEPRMKNVEGAPRNLAQVLEIIRVCSAVRTAQAPALKEFFSRY